MNWNKRRETDENHGSADWSGGIKDGKGSISTKSGALQAYPYGFASRFEGKPGSNPEELIGAAHAACFTMALSLILGEAGLTAERMETTAEVTLDKVSDGFAITAVHLTLEAKIPGADDARFQELAAKAKAGCPVSKLLKADITLDASVTHWSECVTDTTAGCLRCAGLDHRLAARAGLSLSNPCERTFVRQRSPAVRTRRRLPVRQRPHRRPLPRRLASRHTLMGLIGSDQQTPTRSAPKIETSC
jgi:osmotically inducible protein OsmC